MRLSNKRASAISSALFLAGIAILFITNQWWPGFLLVIGLPITFKNLLLNRKVDALVSFIVFVGGFVSIAFNIAWKIILPVIFILGAIHILLKEFIVPRDYSEVEREKDDALEIEEDKEDNK